MSKILVEQFTEKPYTKKDGTSGTIYKCSGYINESDAHFDMYVRPQVNKDFEGEVKETSFGTMVTVPRTGGRSFGKSPEEREDIKKQVALKAAVELVSAGKIELEHLSAYADKCLEWLKK